MLADRIRFNNTIRHIGLPYDKYRFIANASSEIRAMDGLFYFLLITLDKSMIWEVFQPLV